MRPGTTAYVDEAYELGRGGAYVLAAVFLSADTADLRQELKDTLQMDGQQRPHFRKESHKRRRVLADAVASFGLPATAVVAMSPTTAARSRGLCVARLAWEVTDVDAIVFESRGPLADRHDATILAGIARHGPRHTPSFVRAVDDPILWLADIVAGAVFHDLVRGNSAYRTALGAVRLVLL
jgi:hypothetical protein